MAQVTFGFEVIAKNIVDVGDADAFRHAVSPRSVSAPSQSGASWRRPGHARQSARVRDGGAAVTNDPRDTRHPTPLGRRLQPSVAIS